MGVSSLVDQSHSPFEIWVKPEDITNTILYCTASPYIDDLMLFAKMLRAACNDEKSMCNYLGMGFKENE